MAATNKTWHFYRYSFSIARNRRGEIYDRDEMNNDWGKLKTPVWVDKIMFLDKDGKRQVTIDSFGHIFVSEWAKS